jgi:hypothetical protein
MASKPQESINKVAFLLKHYFTYNEPSEAELKTLFLQLCYEICFEFNILLTDLVIVVIGVFIPISFVEIKSSFNYFLSKILLFEKLMYQETLLMSTYYCRLPSIEG